MTHRRTCLKSMHGGIFYFCEATPRGRSINGFQVRCSRCSMKPDETILCTALHRVCGFKNPAPYPVDLGEPPIAPKYILMLQGTPASPIARLPTHQRRSVGRPLTDVLSKQTPVLVNSRSQASMSDANDSDSDDIGEAFPIDSDKTHPANSHQTAKRKAAETARRTKPAAAASRSKAVFSEKVTLVQSSPVRVVSNQAEEHEGRTEPTQDSVCDDLAYMTPAKSKAADACPDSGLSIEHEVLTERPQLELVHDSNSQDEVDQLSLDAMEEVVIEADDGSPIHYQHNQRKRGELGKVDLSLPTDLGFESSAGEGKDAEDVHFNATHTLGLPTQARSGQIASVLLNSPTRPSVPQPTPAEESEKKDDWDDWDGDTEQPKEQKESAPPKPASRPMPKGPQPQRVGRPLPPSARPKPGAAPARGGGAASGRARLLMQQRRHSQQRNPPPARQQASDSKIQDAGAAVDDDFVTADWDE